jgi:hypothetical protein
MKNKMLALLIVVTIILSACTSNIAEDNQDFIEQISNEVDKSTINDFGKELLEGVWVGELILDFYEGSRGEYGSLTKQLVNINLEVEFRMHSTRKSELEMFGNMEFVYETPQVIEVQKGVESVEFFPETNSYIGPFVALISRVEQNLPNEEPAIVNFLDIAHITGGVTVHVNISDPQITQTYSYSANEGAAYASDLYMLRQMSFITLTRDGDGRAVFGPHDHLKPSTSGIEDNIYGYLEKVSVVNREEPLKEKEVVNTDSKERLKARIENRYAEWDLYIEPNTTIEHGETIEESMKIVSGAIFARVRRLTGDQIFKVRLPVAITGVRGTDFYIRVIDEKKVLIRVYSGELEVLYQDEQYILTNNQGILILDDEDKAQTFDFDSAYQNQWWNE